MRRQVHTVNRDWPAWFFSPDGDSAIFDRQEDVPDGWVNNVVVLPEPFVPAPAVLHDQDELMAELIRLSVDIDPTWGVAHMKKVIDDLSSTR